ncbi:MAG: hypothetical protein IPI46_14475 [Bacteroidetes bacterium]|nr:hypothetical protein [Bacteroidota bacterium]
MNAFPFKMAKGIIPMYKIIPFVLWLLIFHLDAAAQNVKVKSRIDSTSILIGNQFQFTLSSTYNPQQVKVLFPTIPDSFNHFEVVQRSKIDTSFGRDENTYTQNFTLTNFDSGAWQIPSFHFDIQSLQGDTIAPQFSDSFLVQVNTIAVDTSQPFKPIFGIRSAKMPVQQMILYVLGIALLLVVLGVLIWYIRKRMKANKKSEVIVPEKIILPHEKALQTLSQIEKEALWQHQQEKIYHTQLTDAMRTYLEEQFNIDCFEKTTTEIIYQVKRNKAFNNSRQALRSIFETADMVKFAKSKPSDDEHVKSLELAVEVVKETYKKVSGDRDSGFGVRSH